MKNIVKIFLTFIWIVMFMNITHGSYWIYYGANKTYAKSLYNKYDLIIMQDYNFNLFKTYTWKKICYLTVWEFDGTSNDLIGLNLTGAQIWENKEWNSIIMDMWNQNWIHYLLQKENNLKNIGCNWLFLDTIWQDGYEKQAIDLIKILKNNWKESYIVVNNWHNIKNEIVDYIDAYMFENYWNNGTIKGSTDWDWYINLSQEYATLWKTYGKKIFALIYWNPNQNIKTKKWGTVVKDLCNTYGFEFIFSNLNINKMY